MLFSEDCGLDFATNIERKRSRETFQMALQTRKKKVELMSDRCIFKENIVGTQVVLPVQLER